MAFKSPCSKLVHCESSSLICIWQLNYTIMGIVRKTLLNCLNLAFLTTDLCYVNQKFRYKDGYKKFSLNCQPIRLLRVPTRLFYFHSCQTCGCGLLYHLKKAPAPKWKAETSGNVKAYLIWTQDFQRRQVSQDSGPGLNIYCTSFSLLPFCYASQTPIL